MQRLSRGRNQWHLNVHGLHSVNNVTARDNDQESFQSRNAIFDAYEKSGSPGNKKKVICFQIFRTFSIFISFSETPSVVLLFFVSSFSCIFQSGSFEKPPFPQKKRSFSKISQNMFSEFLLGWKKILINCSFIIFFIYNFWFFWTSQKLCIYFRQFWKKKKHHKLKLSRSPVGNLLRFQKNLLCFVVFECKHKKREQRKKNSYQTKRREEKKKKSSENIHKYLISLNNK